MWTSRSCVVWLLLLWAMRGGLALILIKRQLGRGRAEGQERVA